MSTIELQQVILGLEPFVLLTFFQGDEGPDDLRVRLNAGGGIGDVEDIRAALTLALASLPAPVIEGEVVEAELAVQPASGQPKESE